MVEWTLELCSYASFTNCVFMRRFRLTGFVSSLMHSPCLQSQWTHLDSVLVGLCSQAGSQLLTGVWQLCVFMTRVRLAKPVSSVDLVSSTLAMLNSNDGSLNGCTRTYHLRTRGGTTIDLMDNHNDTDGQRHHIYQTNPHANAPSPVNMAITCPAF